MWRVLLGSHTAVLRYPVVGLCALVSLVYFSLCSWNLLRLRNDGREGRADECHWYTVQMTLLPSVEKEVEKLTGPKVRSLGRRTVEKVQYDISYPLI